MEKAGMVKEAVLKERRYDAVMDTYDDIIIGLVYSCRIITPKNIFYFSGLFHC